MTSVAQSSKNESCVFWYFMSFKMLPKWCFVLECSVYSICSIPRMLQEDPVLFQLYKDLVVSQVISAEEFWANRLNVNSAESSSTSNHKQDVGISAAFLVCDPLDSCRGWGLKKTLIVY